VLPDLPNLKAMFSRSAGVEAFIDHPRLPKVPLGKIEPAGGDPMMTEYVVMHVLRFHREMPKYQEAQANREWLRTRIVRPEERRVGFLGYGLMAVGLVDMLDSEGNFAAELNRIAAKFDGPLALLIGRGERLIHPDHGPLSVLVPATGTDASRRAAEVAVAIARGNVMPLTALFVEAGSSEPDRRQPSEKNPYVQTILKDLVSLASQSGVAARTAVRSDMAPDEAILREAEAGGFDLIVMGVNRRPGDVLYFGDVAAAVVRDTHASVLLIAS